jgi:hypothetical protein
MTERMKYVDANGLPIKHNQRYKMNGVKGVIQWSRQFRAYVFRSPLGMQGVLFSQKDNVRTANVERVE